MKKSVSILIVGLCLTIGGIAVLRMVNKNILVDKLQMDNTFTNLMVADNEGLLVEEQSISISWAKRYPFEENSKPTVKKGNTVKKNIVEEINDRLQATENKIVAMQEKIDYYYTDALIGYPCFLEAGTGLEEKLNWGMPLSLREPDYVLLPNGHVTGKERQKEVSEVAHNLVDFRSWLATENIDFLYVQFPHKVPKYEDLYANENGENYCNQNADGLLDHLQREGVPYLDIRESIYQSGRNHYDCFFHTDHHWNVESGLFAAQEITIAIGIESINEEEYRTEVMENCYMGSYGRNLTKALIEPDDLSILYPEYETNFHVICEEIGIDRSGSWEETLLDSKKLLQDYSYTISQYDAFAYGDRAVLQIENLNCTDGKRVLLLKDSFADVVTPYLAMNVKELNVLDLRMFTGSVESYVKEYAPDWVIVAYNPAIIAENGKINYNTHEELWDFR